MKKPEFLNKITIIDILIIICIIGAVGFAILHMADDGSSNASATSFDISTKLFMRVDDYLDSQSIDFLGTVSFEEAIKVSEMSFHEYLIQLMIDSGMTNPQIYHNANINRQHFSKIISKPDYIPTKNTICALGLGMHLDIDTLEKLLEKAGYVLSDSKQFDLAIKYFINNKMYNVVHNNMLMYDSGLEQIGTV